MSTLHILCLGFLFIYISHAAADKNHGFGPGKQDFGYVTVKPGAHMFWWLCYTTDTSKEATDIPLFVWLAGGPGSSSVGNGNIDGVGLIDANKLPRNTSWLHDYNVIFIDNPVGTGFSYVEDKSLFSKNNKEIAYNLYKVLEGFYKKRPEFLKTPLYIYGNSYGGRMGIDLAKLIDTNIKKKTLKWNLKGVALGNSWISPIDTTLSYAEFLYDVGLLTIHTRAKVEELSQDIVDTYHKGDQIKAKDKWVDLQAYIFKVTDHVNTADLLTKPNFQESEFRSGFSPKLEDILGTGRLRSYDPLILDELMNGEVKKAFHIPEFVKWGSQKDDLFAAIEDFLDPVSPSVGYMLNNTDVKVYICTGNLDGLITTKSTIEWVHNLNYKNVDGFRNAPRRTMWVNDQLEGYSKSHQQLGFYWMYNSGHISFMDNTAGTKVYLSELTGKK